MDGLTKNDVFYWFAGDMFVVPVLNVQSSFRSTHTINPIDGTTVVRRVMTATFVSQTDQGGKRYRLGSEELDWTLRAEETFEGST